MKDHLMLFNTLMNVEYNERGLFERNEFHLLSMYGRGQELLVISSLVVLVDIVYCLFCFPLYKAQKKLNVNQRKFQVSSNE